MIASPAETEAYHELCAYTLSLRDGAFIHQHVVDTWAAQHADAATKPIGITFALVGLYLHNERGFTGRQVQQAHMQLAQRKQPWPELALPDDRGPMTARDVLAVPAGDARNRAIDEWCATVWAPFQPNAARIEELLRRNGVL